MSKEIDFKNRDRFIQLGIIISVLCKMQGMSQEELAAKAKMSRSHLSAIEVPNTVRPFSLELLFRREFSLILRSRRVLAYPLRWLKSSELKS